jgi:hypothetical protein
VTACFGLDVSKKSNIHRAGIRTPPRKDPEVVFTARLVDIVIDRILVPEEYTLPSCYPTSSP